MYFEKATKSMKMKKIIMLALGVGFLISCTNDVQTNPTNKGKLDLKAITNYIIAMEDTLAMAYRDKDLNLFQKFYAENAVTYGEGRSQLFGKQQIIDHFSKNVVAAGQKKFNFKYSTIDVFATASDMAVETGQWFEMDENDVEISNGFYMVVFQEVNGRLVCVRDTWNSSSPSASSLGADEKTTHDSLSL